MNQKNEFDFSMITSIDDLNFLMRDCLINFDPKTDIDFLKSLEKEIARRRRQ